MNIIKKIIKRNPILEKLTTGIIKLFQQNQLFPGSESYWEKRYKRGGTSGSGSYNRLAIFKADVINSFVKNQEINTIIEFGCGDGNQLALAKYPKYIGLDISPTIIKSCKNQFQEDPSKEFYVYNSDFLSFKKSDFICELSISIDVVFHLIEDHIYDEYMNNLFVYSTKYVIIYSSNYNSIQNYHEKDRKFEDWITANASNWELYKKIDNKYKFDRNDPKNTSKCDFYIYKRKLNL